MALENPTIKALQCLPGLRLEPSRCVQQRHQPTGCERCFRVCPTGAIRWTDLGLYWEQADCQRCMLCVAACPTGALLTTELPLVRRLKLLALEKKPVLACSGQPASIGHARLPCLGLLSRPELLLVFALAMGKTFQLNLLACRDCPNAVMLPSLQAAAAQVSELSAHVVLIEDKAKLEFKERGVSRREFFSLLRRQNEIAVNSLAEQLQELPERILADKSIPPQRLLLMQLLKRLPAQERSELAARLFPQVEISSEHCVGCSGCVDLCPSGALLAPRKGNPPTVHAQNCTDCGLCSAFCGQQAIAVQPGWLSQASKMVLG